MKKNKLLIVLIFLLIVVVVLFCLPEKESILVESNILNVLENSSKKINVLSSFKVHYKSMDETIAIVSDDGEVKGLKPGKTQIEISAFWKESTMVNINVYQKPDLIVSNIVIKANNEIADKYIKVGDILDINLTFNRNLKDDEILSATINDVAVNYLSTPNGVTIIVNVKDSEKKILKIMIYDEIIYQYELPIIDTEIPTCTLTDDGENVVITGEDNLGVKDYAITQSINYTFGNEQKVKYEKNYGTWYGYVRDYANNVGKCSIEIEKKEVIIDPSNITIVGDSRMDALCSYNWYKSDNGSCVSKSAMGYNWLNSTAASKVTSLPLTKRKYIATNLGVNDLGKIDSYIAKYQQLAVGDWKDSMIFIVSVNPTKGKHAYLNNSIVSFNDKIKNSFSGYSNVAYCDVASYLNQVGFQSSDGLHYSQSSSKVIYEQIKKCIYDYYNN